MYVPLGVQTCYSLLESIIKIPDLITFAKDFPAIAMTDEHNLFGAMEFCVSCVQAKVQPIVGCTVNLENDAKIMLFCQNATGYHNLSYLICISYLLCNVYLAYANK